jgi:predicted nucleotidyltransferase/predicted HTH domain antitoxin
MQVTVELPDEIARRLAEKQPDLSRAVLEATAVEAVRDGVMSAGKAAEMLSVSRDTMDGILKRTEVYLDYTLEDLKRDRETHKAVEGRGNIAEGRGIDKSTVIAKLREYEPELKAAGIVRLSLFGSVARGEASAQSDVDLMGDFDRARGLTLFDMAGLEVRLSEILETRVDLSDRRMLKEPVRRRADQEAVLAF